MTGLRWTLICLVLLAALVVASVTAEPSAWRGSVRWAKSWRQQAVESSAHCPVLVDFVGDGEPCAGDARGAYDKAAKMAASVDLEMLSPLRELLRDDSTTREQAMQVVAALPLHVVAALQRAVRTPGPSYSAARLGSRPPSIPLCDLYWFGDVLLARARFDADQTERLHAWLDSLAFGVDLMGMEFPILETFGLEIVDRSLKACDQDWLDALSDATLQRLAAALETVDEATPVVSCLDSIAAHFVLVVHEVSDLEPSDLGMRSIYSTWEYGFSIERAGIDRIGTLRARLERFAKESPPNEPWPSRKVRLEELALQDEQANEDLFLTYLGSIVEREQGRREAVAGLRRLRLVVARRLGDALTLQDPLGAGQLVAPSVSLTRPR